MKKLESITFDGTNSSIKIETIEGNAFYECDQLTDLLFKYNNIKEIKANAFRLKPANKVLSIQFMSNQMNNNSFKTDSLLNLERIISLFLNEKEISSLNQSIFQPFFATEYHNVITLQNFDYQNPDNEWLLENGKIKYPIRIRDLNIENLFLKENFNQNEFTSDLNLSNRLVSPVKCNYGFQNQITITNGSFSIIKNFDRIFEIINQYAKVREFHSLRLRDIISIEEINEIQFGNICFQDIYIHDFKYLRRIHQNSFKQIADKIERFHLFNLANLKSEANTEYDLNKLINSLINCIQIETQSFELQSIQLSKLKSIAFDGSSSSTKIEIIKSNSFSLCNQLESINFENNQIKLIEENAFQFYEQSDVPLVIQFDNNKLNSESFSMNSLINIKRPSSILLENESIGYLNEDVFKPFLKEDKQNVICITPNLDDERNQWILQNEDYIKRINSLIQQLVQEAIDFQICTFKVTNLNYIPQHWFYCRTCFKREHLGVCQVCVNICHKDHDIADAKFSEFYCDCGARNDGSCNALKSMD